MFKVSLPVRPVRIRGTRDGVDRNFTPCNIFDLPPPSDCWLLNDHYRVVGWVASVPAGGYHGQLDPEDEMEMASPAQAD